MGQPTRSGNEFWLAMPIAALPPDAAVPSDRAQAALPLLPRTRILLAEDVIASRIVVARLLRRAGHMVDTVGTGEDAVKVVAHKPYDAVLMDVHMTGINGIDAARQMRTLQGAAGAVPIIALTGTLTGEDAIQCRAAGMNAVLSKPASLAEMIHILAQHAWPGAVRGVQRAEDAAVITSVSVAEAPVLAAARLEELRQHLSPTTLGKLVEDCLLDLRTRLPQLHTAFGDGDIEEIISVSHTMAGVAGSYGMAALDAKMRAVMTAAREQGSAAAAAAADDVEADLARAAAALRDFLSIETV
jgi:two-component system sensor histidine kinase RpfC